MTIQQLLKKYYQSNSLPPQEIDQLLAVSLHRSLEYIYKNPKKELSLSAVKTFDKLWRLRQENYSLARLRGYQEFYGLKFLVNKHTLIPRPASETLIKEALKFLAKQKNSKVIDIGTGSGCLIITLAKNFSAAEYFAVDISASALAVAKTNARKHLSRQKFSTDKLKIKFIKSNLWSKIPKLKFNLIVANLHYLTKEQLKEPSIKREPLTALYGGQNGLKYYEKLLAKIKKFLADQYEILLEIDPPQVADIKNLIKKYLPQANIEILKDLNKDNRVVKIN